MENNEPSNQRGRGTLESINIFHARSSASARAGRTFTRADSPDETNLDSSRRKRGHATLDSEGSNNRNVVARLPDGPSSVETGGPACQVSASADPNNSFGSTGDTGIDRTLPLLLGNQTLWRSSGPMINSRETPSAFQLLGSRGNIVTTLPLNVLPAPTTITQLNLLQATEMQLRTIQNPNEPLSLQLSIATLRDQLICSLLARSIEIPQAITESRSIPLAAITEQPSPSGLPIERMVSLSGQNLNHQQLLILPQVVSSAATTDARSSSDIAQLVANVNRPYVAEQMALPPTTTQVGNQEGSLAVTAPSTTRRQQSSSTSPAGVTSASVPLSADSDEKELSEYQRTIRLHLELFVSEREDVETNVRGRKKKIYLGQVGIRCRHCASMPRRCRGVGSVYYPAGLAGVYPAAQNMATSHLSSSCTAIPDDVKQSLQELRTRRQSGSGGKKYWVDTCKQKGLYETLEGLWFR